MCLHDLPNRFKVGIQDSSTVDSDADKNTEENTDIMLVRTGLDESWKVRVIPYNIQWFIDASHIHYTHKGVQKSYKWYHSHNSVYYFDDTRTHTRVMFFWFM